METKVISILFLFCFFISISNAKIIAPKIYAQNDMGDYTLKQMTYAITVDCDQKLINLTSMDEHIKILPNVSYYVQYIDYSNPLIASNKTNLNGLGIVNLPGETKFLRGLFVLFMQKSGYKNKEIDFAINGCYSNVVDPQLDEELARIAANKNTTNRSVYIPSQQIANNQTAIVQNNTNHQPTGQIQTKNKDKTNQNLFAVLFPIIYKFFGSRIFA